MNSQRTSIEADRPSGIAAGPIAMPATRGRPSTLVEALDALPATAERGFRFSRESLDRF